VLCSKALFIAHLPSEKELSSLPHSSEMLFKNTISVTFYNEKNNKKTMFSYNPLLKFIYMMNSLTIVSQLSISTIVWAMSAVTSHSLCIFSI